MKYNGASIKALRENAKMPQELLGDLFAVTRQTVCNWENNITTPSYDILGKIADKFNVNIEYFFNFDDNQQLIIDTNNQAEERECKQQ